MKTILITDSNLNKYEYHKPDEEVDVFIDEGLRDSLWGFIEDLTFDISDYDPENEPKGTIVREEAPLDPIDGTLWLKKSSGILYCWKESAERWLSVDRAVFTPDENLHSDVISEK